MNWSSGISDSRDVALDRCLFIYLCQGVPRVFKGEHETMRVWIETSHPKTGTSSSRQFHDLLRDQGHNVLVTREPIENRKQTLRRLRVPYVLVENMAGARRLASSSPVGEDCQTCKID